MNTLPMPSVGAAQVGPAPRPLPLRLLGAIVALWSFLWLFQSMAGIGDAQRRGASPGVVDVLAGNLPLYLPWVLFSVALVLLLERQGERVLQTRRVLLMLALATLLFYLPYVAYEVALEILQSGRPWSSFGALLRQWPVRFFFVDYVLFLGCFASLYAVVVFRHGLAGERRRQRIAAENLGLRLALEQQRLVALQAQLEPHFLFNALAAIGSLVRAADQRAALGGLSRLSELLRYALAAGGRERAALGEELDFIRDYLSLQQLRYGERLDVRIEGEDAWIREFDCPPLLLQPLMENALRHDLDCHEHTAHIELRLQRHGDGLVIEIENGAHQGLAPNPGLGLGLRNTRDRLALLYGGRAQLETRRHAGRFLLRLSLPYGADDA